MLESEKTSIYSETLVQHQGQKSNLTKVKNEQIQEKYIENCIKELLISIDNIIAIMENSRKGAAVLDSYRYGVIDFQLDNLRKLTNKVENKLEDPNKFWVIDTNTKLHLIELEIKDIAKNWCEDYISYIQDAIIRCQKLKLLLSNKNGKIAKKKLLSCTSEFCNYAIRQKHSLYKYLNATNAVLTPANDIETIYDRITYLKSELDKPYPLAFNNRPTQISRLSGLTNVVSSMISVLGKRTSVEFH